MAPADRQQTVPGGTATPKRGIVTSTAVVALGGNALAAEGQRGTYEEQRANAERMAMNTPIQGTAADILKKAMIDLHAALPQHGLRTRMILTVHDELLFEVPTAEADAAAALVRERMENAVTLNVPVTVDIGMADNWRDAKS